MTILGVVLATAGVPVFTLGLIGRELDRKWTTLAPGRHRLTPLEQWQLFRQWALIRQGPIFVMAGVAALTVGFALVLSAAVLHS